MLDLRFEKLIERMSQNGCPHLKVIGTNGPVATPFLFRFYQGPLRSSRPHIFVCANDDTAEELTSNFEAFGLKPACPPLLEGEVSPFSGLLPSLRYVHGRLNWLHSATTLQPGQFLVASALGLAQRTMPLRVFKEQQFKLKKGSRVDPQIFRKLIALGYQESPRVEDFGQFGQRGGLIDIFSPAHLQPIRIELFDDEVDTLRFFDPETQRSLSPVEEITVCPARGVLLEDDRGDGIGRYSKEISKTITDRRGFENLVQDLSMGKYLPELEFLTSFFYPERATALDFVPKTSCLWNIDSLELTRHVDLQLQSLKDESLMATSTFFNIPLEDWLDTHIEARLNAFDSQIIFSKLETEQIDEAPLPNHLTYSCSSTVDFRRAVQTRRESGLDEFEEVKARFESYLVQGFRIFISCHTESQSKRLLFLLEKKGLSAGLHTSFEKALESRDQIGILASSVSSGIRLSEENLILLTDLDFFGKQDRRNSTKRSDFRELPKADFSDLGKGDYIVHVQHGVGIFDGLKSMQVQGVENEFIQLTYKDNDRLYLPVFRIGQIQKFTGLPTLDKLGGQNWLKTKIKVRSDLRDIANELLRLYAERSELKRPAYPSPSDSYRRFEMAFPYNETPDQEKAIEDVASDLLKDRPMDRLVCGDVGFGKTEVAIRAAFLAAESGKQVAVLVPTTILAFQHLETFKKRLRGSPFRIESFSRFSGPKELRRNLADLKSGAIQIAIGTHRLLSKDVEFKNLGLLVLDEEQKFGVTHKEKIRKLRSHIDTLAMSATPIPRTLNMSLVGIRDLSLITTAPRDRLPIRTFICKFEEETIRKAILSEVQRGGQVFYVHNRVQTIYGLADELRALMPEVRIRVGHGQMGEGELEDVMVAFFNHEFDVLLSTTIIESGVDIARANTMIVDRADTFGLSQLYQLRGRIGRSKERAYCYLLVPSHRHLDPDAQERLKVLQENSALGSGFRIAQHDLELRGAGNILGEEQSGHINAVGYELYVELLQEVLHEIRGLPVEDKEIEPDMNLKIPALIPDSYIPDIRARLNVYRQLSLISGISDIDQIENDLRDQFGQPPETVFNLFGVMIIRRQCKDLGVRDISAGSKSLSLAFTDKTPVQPTSVIGLATREKSKYSLTPDSRLLIRTQDFTWQAIFEELELLKKRLLK